MSLLLKAKNGNELELAFVRESLADIQDGDGDEQWTTVTIRAATSDDSWEESSPCINLYEFRNLAEWFEALGSGDASGGPEEAEIDLLEPELRFTVAEQTRDGVGVRVYFHIADRPEEFNVDAPTDADYVDLFLDRRALLSAAATLRSMLTDVQPAPPKDDLLGRRDSGILGRPDENLGIVDRIEPKPPGAGRGVDNAGNR